MERATARCWCNDKLHFPSDSCYRCQGDLTNYLTLRTIPVSIIRELSARLSDDWDPITPERQKEDTTPQTYNQVILKKVADNQDRQNCFYCGKKSHLEWKEFSEAIPIYNHQELEKLRSVEFSELSIGKVNDEQKTN